MQKKAKKKVKGKVEKKNKPKKTEVSEEEVSSGPPDWPAAQPQPKPGSSVEPPGWEDKDVPEPHPSIP